MCTHNVAFKYSSSLCVYTNDRRTFMSLLRSAIQVSLLFLFIARGKLLETRFAPIQSQKPIDDDIYISTRSISPTGNEYVCVSAREGHSYIVRRSPPQSLMSFFWFSKQQCRRIEFILCGVLLVELRFPTIGPEKCSSDSGGRPNIQKRQGRKQSNHQLCALTYIIHFPLFCGHCILPPCYHNRPTIGKYL